ncbi:MAG: GIY-YIG nuclease family protein [Ignavibacteriales bacterium]|nr:GIY-YIG nuclease family protein [Ignavibacteriales bacterium]
MLRCSEGTFYTGSTTDLDNRMYEHKMGLYDGYTARRRPVKLMWSDEFPDYQQAFDSERQIKGWSHKKKQALLNGDFDLLHELAQSKEMQQRRQNKKSRSR